MRLKNLIPMRQWSALVTALAAVPVVMRLGPEVGKEPAADTAAIVGFLRERLGNRNRRTRIESRREHLLVFALEGNDHKSAFLLPAHLELGRRALADATGAPDQ